MSLLALPSNIRVYIWRLILRERRPIDIPLVPLDRELSPAEYNECQYGSRQPDDDVRSAIKRCNRPKISTTLLRTCRLIYEEAIDVLYGENVFLLTLFTVGEFPIFDFSRTRSLHLDARYFQGSWSSQDYKKVLQKIRLNPQVNLTITSNKRNQEDMSRLVPALLALGPVKTCNISLPGYSGAKSLARQLAPGEKEQKGFAFYHKLPDEIRLHILSYTDLVREFRLVDGEIIPRHDEETEYAFNGCCLSCCDTAFDCCCNRSLKESKAPNSQTVFDSSAFSVSCRCQNHPWPLLEVFKDDALHVLFAKSSFSFKGSIAKTINFFHRHEHYLKLIRDVALRIYSNDLLASQNISRWTEFLEYVAAHLLLPKVSLRIVGELGLPTYETSLTVGQLTTNFTALLDKGINFLKERGLKEGQASTVYDESMYEVFL